MSEDERQELVDKVELSLDYSENYNLTDNDMALYKAITKERGEKQFENRKKILSMNFALKNMALRQIFQTFQK